MKAQVNEAYEPLSLMQQDNKLSPLLCSWTWSKGPRSPWNREYEIKKSLKNKSQTENNNKLKENSAILHSLQVASRSHLTICSRIPNALFSEWSQSGDSLSAWWSASICTEQENVPPTSLLIGKCEKTKSHENQSKGSRFKSCLLWWWKMYFYSMEWLLLLLRWKV